MKKKGTIFVLAGVLGAIFVLTFDIIVGKPVNYIGPKSIIALVVCGIFAIKGICLLLKK